MGVAFDRWLARPSTLRLFRHLLEPERKHAWCSGIRAKQCFTSGHAPKWTAGRDSTRKSKHHAVRGSMQHAAITAAAKSSAPTPSTFQHDGVSRRAFEDLQFEADVNGTQPCSTGQLRLVDTPEHSHDFQLWTEILDFRQRIDGYAGILDVWHGLRKREVDLPVDGEHAHALWRTFALIPSKSEEVGPATDALAHKLVDYALELDEREGQRYLGLYKSIVGPSIQRHLTSAWYWHARLREIGLLPSDALKQVVTEFTRLSTETKASSSQFKKFYKASEERDLYDTYVSEALAVPDDLAALRLHKVFLKEGDAPSATMFARPDVQRLFDLDQNRALPMRRRDRTAVVPASSSAQASGPYPPLTRAAMSSLVGDVHGIKAKEVGDTFVAKMFATRAFSMELLLKGLGFLGVEALGPLGMRELGLRSSDCAEFTTRLDAIGQMGISILDVPYCNLIRTIASDGQNMTYQTLLASDQHPEAFAETRTQEALLVSYLDSAQWAQANLAMTALCLAGPEYESRAWNRQLQHQLCARNFDEARHSVQRMQAKRLPLTVYTLTCLHRHMLPERRPGKRPVESQRYDRPDFNTLDFVCSAYVYSEQLSGNVHSRLWVELLKRYGMAFRWDGLQKLVLWLVARYTQEPRAARSPGVDGLHFADREGPLVFPRNTLTAIFSPAMQRALVHWGFRSAIWRSQLTAGVTWNVETPPSLTRCEPWARGLALVLSLQDRGVSVSIPAVAWAFKLRMWSLFGPGFSTLRINEVARAENPHTLAHYLRHAKALRNGNEELFFVDERFLPPAARASDEGDGELLPDLMTAYFGDHMRTSLRQQEYAVIEPWSRVVATYGAQIHRGKTMGQRQRAWESSRLRVRRVPSPDTKLRDPARLRQRDAHPRSTVTESDRLRP